MNELLVVTGASRGIGLAVARRFLARGAAVVNLSRSPCPLQGVEHLAADLSVPGFELTLQDPLRKLAEGRDRVVLVHNAASIHNDSVRDVQTSDFARELALNVLAPAALNRAMLPSMPRGSSIIYLGSTLSEKAVAGLFSYVTTKHAVIGMMRATCQDLLGSSIHTACICPGITDTEMLRERTGGDPAVLDSLRAMTGEGRLIDPDEIAALIETVSQQPVLNGAVLHANLGQRER